MAIGNECTHCPGLRVKAPGPGVPHHARRSFTLGAFPLWELLSPRLTNEGVGLDEWFSNIFAHRTFLQKKCYAGDEAALKQAGGRESDGARARGC